MALKKQNKTKNLADVGHTSFYTWLNLCQGKVCNVEKTIFNEKEHVVHSCQ